MIKVPTRPFTRSQLGYQFEGVSVTQISRSPSPTIGQFERRGRPTTVTIGRKGGFSLVEVLVAVLVLTIGLLGLAALQITGLKVTESSQFRTLATLAAYDTIDRLRTNSNPLFNDGALKGKIAKDACPVTGTENNALVRWYQGFCAFKLPQSDQQPNAVTVDCAGTDCGAGNCLIEVFWDDASSVNNLQRSSPEGTSGDKSFRVCTRLLLPP